MTQQSKNSGIRIVRRAPLAMACALFWTACASVPPVEPTPRELGPPVGMETVTSQFVGSLLSGPRVAEFDGENLVECLVEIRFLRGAPGSNLEPLASDLALVARMGSLVPVQGGSRLAVGARWAQGTQADGAWTKMEAGEWGDLVDLEPRTLLLPQGTSYRLVFSAQELVEDPDNFLREFSDRESVRKGFAIGLHHGSRSGESELLAGFALSDLVPAESESELTSIPAEGGRPGGDFLMEEWILPGGGPDTEGGSVLWLLPSPFELQGARSVAIRIQSRSMPIEGVAPEILEAALAELETETMNASADAQPETEEQAERRQLARALRYVRKAGERIAEGESEQGQALRTSMVYLCNRIDMPLAKDLCIAVEEAWLQDWAALIPEPLLPVEASATTLAWGVERAAWVHLARTMVKGDLPPGQMAIVLRHAGEAGHYPSSLEDAARNSIDAATFARRMVLENRLFLEDASPASRVRAFDWLQRRGLEPPDWDPMGTKEERTAPLRQWLAAFENGGEL